MHARACCSALQESYGVTNVVWVLSKLFLATNLTDLYNTLTGKILRVGLLYD